MPPTTKYWQKLANLFSDPVQSFFDFNLRPSVRSFILLRPK